MRRYLNVIGITNKKEAYINYIILKKNLDASILIFEVTEMYGKYIREYSGGKEKEYRRK